MTKFSTGTLLQLEGYVKLVEAVNRLKETKPLVTLPKGIVYNPAYHTYSQ